MKFKKISQRNKKHSKQKEIGFKCCTGTCILGHRKQKLPSSVGTPKVNVSRLSPLGRPVD